MMLEQPRIRIATSADVEQLAALAERTFRDTFADDNSTDDMDAYVRDSFSLDHVRDDLADDANTFLLAFVEGKEQPGGYAKLRTGMADPSVSGRDPIELQRLYVDRSAIGRGVGAVSCGRASTRPDCRVIERFGSVCGNATRERSCSMNSGNSRRSENTSSG